LKIAFFQPLRTGTKRPDAGFSILYLDSYLRKYEPDKYECDIFFVEESFDFSGLSNDYGLVGISSVSCTYEAATHIAEKIKKVNPSIPIVLGGAHISASIESLRDVFDLAVIGEGEEVIRDICNLIYKNGKIDKESIKSIPGLIYRDNDEVKQTPQRISKIDINEIPFPDRKKFAEHSHIQSLITSRGCPFKCLYCANVVYKGMVRGYSAENIYRELREILDIVPETRVIVFRDDIITLNVDKLRILSELISNDSAFNDVKFTGYGHVKFVNEEVVKLLLKMNFKKIVFGFESVSSNFLEKIKGGNIKPDDIIKAIELCHRLGLRCMGNFMNGFPNETEDEIIENYKFILDNLKNGKIFMIQIAILMPYPETDYWSIAKEKYNIEEKVFNWNRTENLSYNQAWEISNKKLSVKEYWQMREDLGLLYIGSQEANKMCEIIDRYETEIFNLVEKNYDIDRANC
tara:strand:- start:458 stop:1840 length:1383 start_codon:yes stop_codon:yes gene_type:complete